MWKIILSIAAISIVGIAVLFLVFNLIIRRIFHLPPIKNPSTPADFGFDYNEYFIPTTHHKKIQVWDLNPQIDAPVLIGVHGWANTSASLLPLAKFLSGRWRIVLLNTRNHGDSDWEGYSTMPHYAEDILSTVRFVSEQHLPGKPLVLLGHSMGAASSIYAAGKDRRVKGVVSIASFANIKEMMHDGFVKNKLPGLLIQALLTYIEFRIGEKLQHLSPEYSITQLNVPVLLIHGDQDSVVPFSDMERIFQAGRQGQVEKYAVAGQNHSSLLAEESVAERIDRFLSLKFNRS